jgi:hypothetical protein
MDEKQISQIEKEQVFAAKKKVKRIRALYLHLFAFVALNLFLFIDRYLPSEVGSNYYYFILVLWGVWLAYSCLKVFGNFWIFSEKWEKKMFRRLLAKEKRAVKQKSKG